MTPLAAMRDTASRVTVALDAELMRAEIVNFHPLVNTATIGMKPAELIAFLERCGHAPLVVELGAL